MSKEYRALLPDPLGCMAPILRPRARALAAHELVHSVRCNGVVVTSQLPDLSLHHRKSATATGTARTMRKIGASSLIE
jgi:hypothetical protein